MACSSLICFVLRYIRAQKSNEKHNENVPKNMKKTNREAWYVDTVLCQFH